MSDEMTAERLAEIRERWGDRWEYETAGGWRPVNLRHALDDAADLLAEVERLRNIEMEYCSLQQTAAAQDEEVERLREQVKTLQAELEICRGERFGTDPAAWGQSLDEAWKRLGLPVTEEGPTP